MSKPLPSDESAIDGKSLDQPTSDARREGVSVPKRAAARSRLAASEPRSWEDSSTNQQAGRPGNQDAFRWSRVNRFNVT